MSRRFWLAPLAFLACCSAFAASQTLHVGERATLTLEENPSTGYAWRIDERATQNAGVVRIEDKGFAPLSNGPAIGAPGTHAWGIEALAKGEARIEFVYQRSWESTPIKQESWSVVVQ